MSNIEIRDNITNDIIEEEETMEIITTCAHCGCVIENDDYHEIDGKYYCDECVVECAECGELILKDDASEYEGDYYCEDCFIENFAECHRCGEFHRIEDMVHMEHWRGDRYYCEDCRDEELFECERCGEWHYQDDEYQVIVNECGDIESWCQVCVEDYTWICEECGERYSCNVDHDDDYICPNCDGRTQDTSDINAWRAPRGVRNYSYKPDPCLCCMPEELLIPNLIHYGFELEIDKAPSGTDHNDFANFINDESGYTYCKHDGSLDNGLEIVSHPATLAYHMSKKDVWERIFEQLVSEGYKSHDARTCGLHVHISLKPMEEQNPMAVNNMLFLMDHFWDKLVKFSRRTEEQLSHWARRYSRLHGDYEDWKRQAKDTRDRYYALNLQNKYTVEIRMFRGTLNLDTFIATLQFVDTLTKRCVEITDLRKLQSMTWEELVQSDWPELNTYLKQRALIGTPEEMRAAEAAMEAEQQRKREEERRREVERAGRAHSRELRRLQDEYDMRAGAMPELAELAEQFPFGAHVEVVSNPDDNSRLIGLRGRVVRIANSTLPVGVDFWENAPVDDLRTHDLNGFLRSTHSGYWCHAESLRIVND